MAYDASAPNYAWQSDPFTWVQLQQMLDADPRTAVGTLQDIQFLIGVSGRVYCATIIGNDCTVKVSGALLKGVYNNQRFSGDALKSHAVLPGARPELRRQSGARCAC